MTIEQQQIKNYLDEAFSYLSIEEREKMLNKLFSFGNEAKFYVEFINNNISKIGVKYEKEELRYKFYYTTKFDCDLFDLWMKYI